MKDEVNWITDALSSKNLAREMTHYRIQDREIRATDGRLTAGHPFDYTDEAFLVPGAEFEKLIKRLPGTVTIQKGEDKVTLRAGRSTGTIKTLPIEEWDYPGIDDDGWEDAPEGLISALKDLRPFVSDNATHAWALGVALYHGYAYATNNVALAGVRCDALGEINAILPVWAVEFIIDRAEGLVDWAWTDTYVAFRWENGAWMRAQLIDAVFPEQAVKMILSAQQSTPSQPITNEFREAYKRAAELCPGAIVVTSNAISGEFGEARYTEGAEQETLVGRLEPTIWSTKHLTPVIDVATSWEPNAWPRSNFKGERIFGLLAGRHV